MNPVVAGIWWVTLVGSIFGFLPNLVSWLERTLASARHIEQYTAEILASGGGIAANTSNAAALKDTLSVAPGLVSGAQSIEGRLTALEAALADGAAGGGRRPRREGRP